jgi:two-component system sensor histidine kinase/response regulator
MKTTLQLLDRVVLLDRVGGDEALLVELTHIFLEEYPRMLSEISEALAAGDAKAVERSAHTLKGSVSTFGAHAATQAAHDLEKLGRQGRVMDAAAAFPLLEAEFSVLKPALEALLP